MLKHIYDNSFVLCVSCTRPEVTIYHQNLNPQSCCPFFKSLTVQSKFENMTMKYLSYDKIKACHGLIDDYIPLSLTIADRMQLSGKC